MIFENGRHTNYNFSLYNSPVECVSSFKYLGVQLFKNGNWNRTQRRIAQHAAFSLHNLFMVNNQIDLPISQKLKLFDSLVSPVLNYAAEIWGHHPAPDVESIHSKFCRKLLCVRRSSNLDSLYGELGRIPMSIHRQFITIKYWIKILNQNENSILFKSYMVMKLGLENDLYCTKNNWAFNIKQILDECGLAYIWHNQFNVTVNYEMIKQRILDIYYQHWYSCINNSNRLETYCLFKHDFKFESYLDNITDSYFRKAFTQFRISSHELAIERGRHLHLPRNNRICPNCSNNQIENEYHFLLICSKYSDLRTKYIKRYYYTWPSLRKFTNLLSNKSISIAKNMSKFIYYANLKRVQFSP